MITINVLCIGCNNGFKFTHPAVSSVSDLAKLTITCKACERPVRVAQFHAVVEPLHTQVRRALVKEIGEEAANNATFTQIEPGDDPFTGKDDGIRGNAPTVEHKTYSGLTNSPLSNSDELAALRDRLMGEGK